MKIIIYIVSGRKVPGTKKTFLDSKDLNFSGKGLINSNFIKVNSCGKTPSPEARS